MKLLKVMLGIAVYLAMTGFPAAASAGTLEIHTLNSTALAVNLIGINPEREIRVYLPESYNDKKAKSRNYPVVYFFHNAGWSSAQVFGEEGNNFKAMLDKCIANGELDEVIVVAGDFRAPHFGSFYSNAPSSGRWLDHITQELIPYVDGQYRTQAENRIAIGDSFGGYATIRLAMDYPKLFTAIYSMHPIGTATGETLLWSRPDWELLNRAKSWKELEGPNPYTPVFMVMAQAYLPNPDKPPFYADLLMELKGEELLVNSENVRILRERFLLDEQVPEKAAALKQLKAFKMDWGRYDLNPDHVYANQKFTRLLSEYGVKHEAEEYSGNAWDKYWGDEGRVRTEVLPFIQKVLH